MLTENYFDIILKINNVPTSHRTNALNSDLPGLQYILYPQLIIYILHVCNN